ncbi:hypothetical protein [Streptomyces sp. AB3(2024)]|uniref:hypothetical protein n=1 Tax=Streptomyces sp. AB3(2024) TaxID=3317321 RepID=UPI0035A2ABF6
MGLVEENRQSAVAVPVLEDPGARAVLRGGAGPAGDQGMQDLGRLSFGGKFEDDGQFLVVDAQPQ